MNDVEWKNYLATLPPQMADALYHTMERVNTVINRERHRAIGEHQEIHQQLDQKKTKLADLRMIVADLVERFGELERKVNNDASNQARADQHR